MNKFCKNLMLYYTGLTRISSVILAEQKSNIADKRPVLDEMAGMVDQAERALA